MNGHTSKAVLGLRILAACVVCAGAVSTSGCAADSALTSAAGSTTPRSITLRDEDGAVLLAPDVAVYYRCEVGMLVCLSATRLDARLCSCSGDGFPQLLR